MKRLMNMFSAVGLVILAALFSLGMLTNVGRVASAFQSIFPGHATGVEVLLTDDNAWVFARIMNWVSWLIILIMLYRNNTIKEHKQEALLFLVISGMFVIGSVGNGLVIFQFLFILYGIVVGTIGALGMMIEACEAWSPNTADVGGD